MAYPHAGYGLDTQFRAAVTSSFLDLPFRQTVAHLEQELTPAPVSQLLEHTAAFYQLQLHRHPEATRYLEHRGLHNPALVEELGIGHPHPRSPDHDSLL